jgi:hypothetical protein
MLNTRTSRWVAGTVLLCVALLALSWFLLLAPRRANAAELDEQNVAAGQANNVLRAQIADLRAQFAKLPERQAELRQIQEQLPATAGMPKLVRDLDGLASASGVTITAITPSAPEYLDAAAPGAAPAVAAAAAGGQKSSVVKIPIVVALKGDYFQSVVFLKKLQLEMKRSFLVKSLQVAPESPAAPKNIIMTVTGEVFSLPNLVPTPAASASATAKPGATPSPTATP